ncbi:unnamed protein product [Phytophthora lilii]|uniref:Unnamed protein product n=1 Tax=Phytophthora lilii TaxID=2077276 RepID=A0A9W6TCC3_9STRA|nr:unnamed protein product [Phytophthora lilii]
MLALVLAFGHDPTQPGREHGVDGEREHRHDEQPHVDGVQKREAEEQQRVERVLLDVLHEAADGEVSLAVAASEDDVAVVIGEHGGHGVQAEEEDGGHDGHRGDARDGEDAARHAERHGQRDAAGRRCGTKR